MKFADAVYGEQVKSADDIEDFALLRSDGMPTYHLASARMMLTFESATHHSWTRPSFEHLQARLDLRGGRLQGPAVCAFAVACGAGWNEALETASWAGCECHDLSGRRISSAGVH